MKTVRVFLLAVALFALGIAGTFAQGQQKIVYVDSEYIMSNIPEYADAQEELNSLSTKWENEIKAIYASVEKMYRDYQTESVLLSEDQKQAREQEIIDKEQQAKNLQMQYFGTDGQLFQKRTELVQPIQEKIYSAINEIALTKNYGFVFDLASGTSLLYANDKNDISDDVLDQLGNVMQTVSRESRKKASTNAGSSSMGRK